MLYACVSSIKDKLYHKETYILVSNFVCVCVHALACMQLYLQADLSVCPALLGMVHLVRNQQFAMICCYRLPAVCVCGFLSVSLHMVHVGQNADGDHTWNELNECFYSFCNCCFTLTETRDFCFHLFISCFKKHEELFRITGLTQ